MSDPFVAEIRILPCNFAPHGWAFCNGQLMPISQNTALFSLLGTTYGGNGMSTFALPDLQGNAPMHPGQGPGLSLHDLGEIGGTETVQLLTSEIPSHTHSVAVAQGDATDQSPQNSKHATAIGLLAYTNSATNTQLAPQAADPAGGGLPHNNMQPYLTLNFCIALQGIFPPRP
jgi:microcystin-dependent protein